MPIRSPGRSTSPVPANTQPPSTDPSGAAFKAGAAGDTSSSRCCRRWRGRRHGGGVAGAVVDGWEHEVGGGIAGVGGLGVGVDVAPRGVDGRGGDEGRGQRPVVKVGGFGPSDGAPAPGPAAGVPNVGLQGGIPLGHVAGVGEVPGDGLVVDRPVKAVGRGSREDGALALVHPGHWVDGPAGARQAFKARNVFGPAHEHALEPFVRRGRGVAKDSGAHESTRSSQLTTQHDIVRARAVPLLQTKLGFAPGQPVL